MQLVYRWKNSIINFKDRRLLLNERNKLVFKCRHKSKLELNWVTTAETPTLDNSKGTDVGWFFIGNDIHFSSYKYYMREEFI